MKGGVTLFRGTGTAACRYLESDRSTADDYYLEGGTALAEFTVTDATGEVVAERSLSPEEYADWVDWIEPLTGTSLGTPRLTGDGRKGSPRFAEMVVNTPKSLSIAAALHPEVSDALDVAQRDAATEIRRWLAQHSVTRVGPRGLQEVVPVEGLQSVAVLHRTSRASDPHRHIHFQVGTRVRTAGRWRALDTAALFKQQGAIRALGTAVVAAHPRLATVLDAHGLTLDPVTGEVVELEPFNALMSKRAAQVERNLAAFTAEWEDAHPGQEPGPVVRARLHAKAWDHQRPNKKPTTLGSEDGWRRELADAGYTACAPRAACRNPVRLDELRVQHLAARALDRCAAGASAWTIHTVQEHTTRIITEYGVQATPEELRNLIAITTRLAAEDCLSILPPGAATPEHSAHLTSLRVVAAETELRDLLASRADAPTTEASDVSRLAQQRGLDADQERAAAAVASTAPLVVVEGAAGAGKTTMLGVAIAAAEQQGRATRVVTPTKKAADVAAKELGVSADSVAALVHAHGWRWNDDGVWTRLAVGDIDPDTGNSYTGPLSEAWLVPGERVVVDEAGMLDQDTALALLRVADEAGATLALVGDRAQLPAVGRGGVLDIAAALVPEVFDMATVHRFADPAYADLTLRQRQGENPAALFDQLASLGLVRLHESDEVLRDAIASTVRTGDAITAATNEEARTLNERIRERRVTAGEVDDTRTAFGSDSLPIGAGDVIQTRRNDAQVGVANRQTWTIQQVAENGDLYVVEAGNARKQQRTVRLPEEYVAEHAHLAYAVTAYGVQGATVDVSHTVLSDALDAAGVYVGMTRGRHANVLHIVATDLDDAREQFTEALIRDRADRGLAAATTAAREEVAGLVAHGPVAEVNAERARLREFITKAERRVEHIENALRALAEQTQQHRRERDRAEQIAAAAEAHAAKIRSEVLTPLVEQATADGEAFLASLEASWEAHSAQSGRFGKRAAGRAAREASAAHRAIEREVRNRWGNTPQTDASLPRWVEAVTNREADRDDRVVEVTQQATRPRRALRELNQRQLTEHADLADRLLETTRRPADQVKRLKQRAEQARAYLDRIESLPPAGAARLIRQQHERMEAEHAAAEKERRKAQTRSVGPSRTDPERDHGRSL